MIKSNVTTLITFSITKVKGEAIVKNPLLGVKQPDTLKYFCSHKLNAMKPKFELIMKKNLLKLFTLLIMAVFVMSACEKKDDPKDDPKPQSKTPGKQISYFKIVNPAVTGIIDSVARTITFTVPAGTTLTSLATDIAVAIGHTISPASGAAQNFTNPVTYTVTKPDNTTTSWTVKIAPPKSMTPGKQFTHFKIVTPAVTGVIDSVNRTITATVPTGTALTSLNTDISIAAGHTISPASGVAQNFTSPVTYTVTKPDNTTTTWTVKVVTPIVVINQDVTSSVTWTADKIYTIDTEIEVKNASVLTIEPGTVIKFGANGSLTVGYASAATVIAIGTVEKPIIFTSSALLPAAGAWEGITFYNGTLSNSILSYCQILFAGKNTSQGALHLSGCDIKMNNCIIDNSGSYGISTAYSNEKGGFVTYESNLIKNTAKYAIELNAQKISTLVTGNTFTNTKGIHITGDYNSSTAQTWNNLNVPYIVTDELDIDGNLTIAPGTTFKFEANGWIEVGYYSVTTFIADGGAATTPITFTSNAATPNAGAWKGIVFYDDTQTNSKMNFCVIDYAGQSPTNMGAILMSGTASITFTNNILRNSAGYGINMSGEAGFEAFNNNTITSCANHLITISHKNLPDLGTPNTLTAATGKGIEIWGDVKYTSPVTWKKQTADFYVKNGEADIDGTLTIEPGCKFLFVNDAYYWFGYYENTKITAVGTADNKITFTSAAASPTAGTWKGLYFDHYVQTNSSLDHCVFQYTGMSSESALFVETAFNVSNTSIADHSGTNKAVYSSATAPTGTGNNFTWTAY